MKQDQLPPATQAQLGQLLSAIEQALAGGSSPHTHAVSESSIDRASGAVNGGSIQAPGKPPFNYNRKAIVALHRALLESAPGVLFGIVVHASRRDSSAPWTLRTKLRSEDEQNALVTSRKRIDAAVERELRKLTSNASEYVSFGRDRPYKDPEVVRRTSAGLERLTPSPELLQLLDEAERLYRASDLDLRVALWTLETGGLDYREYVE